MNTNLNSQIPAARSLSGEGWATVAGVIGSALLLALATSAESIPKLTPAPAPSSEVGRELARVPRQILQERFDRHQAQVDAFRCRVIARFNFTGQVSDEYHPLAVW